MGTLCESESLISAQSEGCKQCKYANVCNSGAPQKYKLVIQVVMLDGVFSNCFKNQTNPNAI